MLRLLVPIFVPVFGVLSGTRLSPLPQGPTVKHSPRAAASIAATAVVALLAPASSSAASAVGTSVGETTFGSLSKTLSTLSGRGDASCIASTDALKAFAPWGDQADYVEAPGGSFEPGAATPWSTSGSVGFSSENEPWRVSGRSTDGRSVVLATGASVTSPTMCAGLAYPTLRFFARAPKGSALGLVTARYTGPDGLLAALPLGLVKIGSSWQPTSISLTGSGIPLITGTTLSVRISPISGTMQLDDVYIDPARRS